jgi:hypothetical protein
MPLLDEPGSSFAQQAISKISFFFFLFSYQEMSRLETGLCGGVE